MKRLTGRIIMLAITLLSLTACEAENVVTSDSDTADEIADEHQDGDLLISDKDKLVDEDEMVDEDIDSRGDDLSRPDEDEIVDETADDLSDEDVGTQDFAPVDEDETVDDDIPTTYPADDPNELIKDRHFQRGFSVVNRSNVEIGTINSDFSAETPVWEFVFGSSQSTHDTLQPHSNLPSGAMLLEDDYSRMIIGSAGMAEADLTLGIWGYEQYDASYYVPGVGQEWVYHLAQQQISYPGDYNRGSPPISALSHLDFNLFARLLVADQNKQNGYNENNHAAQYLIYFTIQNQKEGTAGFGDYLWFGITVYEDRYPIMGLVVMQDSGGTEQLIYNLGNEPFITEPFVAEDPGKLFEGDLLPAMRDALTRAWANGFLTGSNNLADYRIGGMNIGWEVSGLNDVEMQVKDLSLIYEKKEPAPLIFDFNKNGDREGWSAVNITEVADGPQDGTWLFNVGAATPMLSSPELSIEAATHTIVRIIIANDHNPADDSILKVYWDRFGESGLREEWSKSIAVDNSGGFQTLDIDMSKDAPGWIGEIRHLRVDPILSGDGHTVGIDQIAILPTP